MARLFDDAQSEYLRVNSAILAGTPLAMACWFISDTLTQWQTLVSISDKDINIVSHSLELNGTLGGDPLSAITRQDIANYARADSSIAYSANTWQHGCGIWASSTDRRVLLNAGSKGTSNSNYTPVNLDTTSIGAYIRPAIGSYLSGMIAEAAIYDLSAWPGATDALKADAFEKILPSLAKGFTPAHFPLGLVAYWPLIRGLNDKVGGYNLTATGTVVFAHPRIIQPCGIL